MTLLCCYIHGYDDGLSGSNRASDVESAYSSAQDVGTGAELKGLVLRRGGERVGDDRCREDRLGLVDDMLLVSEAATSWATHDCHPLTASEKKKDE